MQTNIYFIHSIFLKFISYFLICYDGVGTVQASPSVNGSLDSMSPAEKEKLRTIGALLALYWIITNSYERYNFSFRS